MAIGHLLAGQLSKSAPRRSKVTRVPAPILGIDSRAAVAEGSPHSCIYTYNLQPYEYGIRVRKGYREWQVGVETSPGAGNGITCVIPFDGVERDHSGDRLFVVTNEGIWDVTESGGTPELKLAFTDVSDEAGYGVYSHYTGLNGADVLFFADSANGLFSYDSATDVWAQASGITGPDITNISWVTMHKSRLWVFEKDTTVAWYLGVDSQSGNATEFFFGAKFRHGGYLAGLFNWSVDGGAGVEDYLVAVSNAGDVLAFQGLDPEDASWDLRGDYYIGEIPRGPNFGSEHGGELFLLSSFGVVSMNQLLQGTTSEDTIFGAVDSPTGKISMVIRDSIRNSLNTNGWSIRTAPSEAALLITRPHIPTAADRQFYFNYVIGGWGYWRDLPMQSFDSWQGNIVMGTRDHRVGYMDINVDNVELDPIDPENNGEAITFSILTSFQTYELAGVYKRVKLIRPDYVTTGKITSSSLARYDYDIGEAKSASDFNNVGNSEWDAGIWDLSKWASNTPQGWSTVGGSWGMGRYVAIATQGKTRSDTRLIGWDVIFDSGGPLL